MLWHAIALWLAATHSTVLESGGVVEDKEKAEFCVVDVVFGHIVVDVCLQPGLFNWEDGTGWGGTEQHYFCPLWEATGIVIHQAVG